MRYQTAKFIAAPVTDLHHSDIIKIILAFVLPPLGVVLERGVGA